MTRDFDSSQLLYFLESFRNNIFLVGLKIWSKLPGELQSYKCNPSFPSLLSVQIY